MEKFNLFLIYLILAVPCRAATIIVDPNGSGDYLTIQEGIDAATDADTVIVADGTYTGAGNENIDFCGKAITVRSENGPENCVIKGPYPMAGTHRGFYFHNNEGPDSVVEGFTITNCWSWSRGGGINCQGSSPTIRNCKIHGNKTANMGGGIRCIGSPTIINCEISSNNAHSGGGIYCRGGVSPIITNCTISGNTQMYNGWPINKGGGINADIGSNPVVNNCILWGNSARFGNEIALDNATMTVGYSNVEGGYEAAYVEGGTLNWQPSNIDVDPMFAPGRYDLLSGSPCIDAGTNNPPGGLHSTDIDGYPRVVDGDGDSTIIADMGAYEFNPGVPFIWRSPVKFDFRAFEGMQNPPDQTLSIANIRYGTLNWEITEDCLWLQTNPNSGSCTGDDVNEVTLTVDISGLTRGTYNCTLTISDPLCVKQPSNCAERATYHCERL